MIAYFDDWKGTFFEDSVTPTIYSFWQLYFYRSLFYVQIPERTEESLAQRMAISDNYQFFDFLQTLLADIAEKGEGSKYNKICAGYHTTYSGTNHCAFNMAMAFVEAKEFLTSSVSKD